MEVRWPLVGRGEELQLIAERLTGPQPGAVLLAGAAGVGKTRLAQEALDIAAACGLATAHVAASRAASNISLGVFAPLLPDDERPVDGQAAILRRAAAAIARLGDGRPIVLAVDDAHHLDETSAALIHQLAQSHILSLLLTVRTGAPAPDIISLLWKDGLADRVELQALSRPEVVELAGGALCGQLDGAFAHQLWTASQGNPLYVRELVSGALASGALRDEDGIWRLRGTFAIPSRLVELVEMRLGMTGDEDRSALEFLAVAENFSLSALEGVFGRDPLERLERDALISVGTDERRCPVRLAHPMYGEALRASMPATRVQTVKRQLAVLIEKTGARRRGDTLRVGLLHLDSDGDADPHLLSRAAHIAASRHDAATAARLARSAILAGAGTAARWLLGEMLRWQGDHDQAEQVLGQAAAEASTDEERGLVISARAENLFRGLGRYADAVRVLRDGEAELADPVWRDEMVALRGQFDLLAGGVAGALRTVEPILHGPPSRASLTASMTSALALAVSGRNDEAVQMADEGIEACSALSPEEALPRRGWLMVSRCFALVESGRLSEAESMATTAYEYSLGAGLTLGQGWFALILGRLCLGAGRLFAADRWFREAAAAFREVDYPGPLRWSLGGAAQAAAMRGDHDGAASAINEADLIATPVRLMETEIDRGRAWLVAMQGERTRAVDILRAAAGRARSTGEIALEGSALHDVVRLGEADEVAHRLTEIATSVPSATAVLRASHAEALVGRDARAMEEVVTGFEAIGALLLAAEAAAQSSLVWKRMGRSRQATAIARRAHELASSCEGARTPVLSEADTLKPLTRREREVCELASNGFTNHAIAERLFLSERTVENHLRAVYAKLGVAGREELRVGARQRVLQN